MLQIVAPVLTFSQPFKTLKPMLVSSDAPEQAADWKGPGAAISLTLC